MKFWHRKKRNDSFDDWEYQFDDEKKDYTELKKAALAMALFCAVYGLKFSGTQIGNFVDQHVQWTVTEYTDVSHVAERMQNYLPEEWRSDLVERVQSVLAKPADPLQYMNAPSEGVIISSFGVQVDSKTKKDISQDGIEYSTVFGSNVRAASLGTVKKIYSTKTQGSCIVLDHGQGIESIYGYMGEIGVQEGEKISQGQIIGKSGMRPVDKEPALYFEVREKNVPVNPSDRLRGTFRSEGGK